MTHDQAAEMSRVASINEIWRQAEADTEELIRVLTIAEDETEAAQARHPEQALRLFHAVPLLWPAVRAMTEVSPFVYAGHCREILERVAAGEDTRPGTAAEIVFALAEVHLSIPLHGAGYGLYLRMWHEACPGVPFPWPDPGDLEREVEHYERMEGSTIDEHVRHLRRKLSSRWRAFGTPQVGTPECDGLHHGNPVTGCPFAERPVPAAFRRRASPVKGPQPALSGDREAS